jgi:membrane fusion protein
VSSSLFRPEALRARFDLQPVINVRLGKAGAVLTTVSMLILVALMVFGLMATKSRITYAGGNLMPSTGLVEVAVPVSGTVEDIRKPVGSAVKAGEVIAVIRTSTRSGMGDTQRLASESARQRLALLEGERTAVLEEVRVRREGLYARAKALEAQQKQADREVEHLRARVAGAEALLKRQQALKENGFLSEAGLMTAQDDLLDAKARLAAGERAVATVASEISAAMVEMNNASAGGRVQVSKIESSRAEADRNLVETVQRERTEVVATVDGYVSTMNVNRGSSVLEGQQIGMIVPDGPDGRRADMMVELFVPSSDVSGVVAGQEVWVRYASYPYQKFGMGKASITSVSVVPVNLGADGRARAEAAGSQGKAAQTMHRVAAALSGSSLRFQNTDLPLHAGMEVQAGIVHERRSVAEWVFGPAIAALSRP